MNSDFSSSPHQELEVRLTALLLGELPAEEAAALQQAIAQDSELAKLHERLKATITLVHETEHSPTPQTSAEPAPLALSENRRQKLLAHFKTVAPKVFARPPRRRSISLVELGVAAALVGLIGLASIPNFQRARSRAQRVQHEAAVRSSDAADLPNDELARKQLLTTDGEIGVRTVAPQSAHRQRSGALGPTSPTELPPKPERTPTSVVLPPSPGSAARSSETSLFDDNGMQRKEVALASAPPEAPAVVPAKPASLGENNPLTQRSSTPRTDATVLGISQSAPQTINGDKERLDVLAPRKSAEVEQDESRALGFDWNLGKQLQGNEGKAPDASAAASATSATVPNGNKVPALGDLPVAGRFFRSKKEADQPTLSTWSAAESGVVSVTNSARTFLFPRENSGAPTPQTVDGPYTLNVVGYVNVGAATNAIPLQSMTNIIASSDSDSPVGELGRVHRGTPWATVLTDQTNSSASSYDHFTLNRNLTQLDASSAPAFKGSPVAANPQGFFPGTSLAETAKEPAVPGRAPIVLPAAAPESKEVATVGAVEAPRAVRRRVLAPKDEAAAPLQPPVRETAVNEAIARQSGAIAEREKLAKSNLLETRTFKVDPKAFKEGLQSVMSFDFGPIVNRQAAGNSGGISGGGISGGGGPVSREPATAGAAGMVSGLRSVTRTNTGDSLQEDLRTFLNQLAGIDFGSNSPKSVFFNDRDGTLVVRATPQDLALIKDVSDTLSSSPTAYARTNLVVTSKGRQLIYTKLNRIHLDTVELKGLLLTEAIANLNDGLKSATRKRGVRYEPEIQTCDNPFSTFSLNVSDVSFKLAAASLEKGALPEPATIRSEEFINAFDYRDPEPPPGVRIAFAWDRAGYPFAQNRDLLRFSLKTAAQGRQAGRSLNLVLLLDNSGSMERADRARIIHEALRVLATQLQAKDTLSVVTFARTARLWLDGVPGSQAGQVADELSGLTPEGGTNLEEAMNLAYQTALRHYLANGINRVVLLTDGAANLGNVEPDALKKKVEDHRRQGIALDCFGIGWEGYNDDLLEVLSRHGDGRYGFLNTPEEAATEFAGQLAGALHVAAADVKVQVEFNPNRVSVYRQIGYAKHQLTKEQFRDNTVDAAEIGAAESGNALYVVAINPAGEGPLATVRVRYKVPGTTEYHEHEWPVPYTGSAPVLDQAAPAMRLAATASAFSEWLGSSPYAGEVTPDRLLGYLRGLPEMYGADGRPKKLEWMLRQAKSLAGK